MSCSSGSRGDYAWETADLTGIFPLFPLPGVNKIHRLVLLIAKTLSVAHLWFSLHFSPIHEQADLAEIYPSRDVNWEL